MRLPSCRTSGVALVLAIAVTLGLANKASATVTPMEGPDHMVTHLRVSYVEKIDSRHLWTEFNDGSVAVFTPCRLEDSPNCYWLGTNRANGAGHSFVDIGGRTFYIRHHLLVEAGLS